MPPSSLDYVVGGAAVIALAMVYRQRNPRKPDAPLPPGPPRWPLIGSLLSLPQNEPNWVAFARWGREMDSDVVYLRVMGSDTIVLNSREAAMELLDRRSSIYSDRPWMVMASELVGWGDMLGMCRYGEKARGMRRLLHGTINSKAMEDWWPIQEKEALKFVQKLLREPDNLISHIRHTAGATVAKLTYGYTVQDESDEYVARAERAASSFSASSTPGAFLVDIFPTLKYIPWAPFHRKAAEWRAHMLDLVESPMRLLNEQLNSGTAEPSFVSNWLEESGQAEDRSLIPWAAASLYVGGADTTVSAISTFFLAMLHHPDSQKMAQAEIDQVVGKGRLPNLADRESLPYIEAVYKEVLRWQPLGPIGIPHKLASDTDDNYNGMRIPANSMVIPNIWSMARDPAVYKSPESFNPSRFLGPEGESNPEEVVFGFGRRRCPGVAVAQSSVWLSIALTLAAFDITPETGKDGRPELPSIQYTSGTPPLSIPVYHQTQNGTDKASNRRFPSLSRVMILETITLRDQAPKPRPISIGRTLKLEARNFLKL